MNFLLPARVAWADPVSWGDSGFAGKFPLAPRTRRSRKQTRGGWGGTPSACSVLRRKRTKIRCSTDVLYNWTQFMARECVRERSTSSGQNIYANGGGVIW